MSETARFARSIAARACPPVWFLAAALTLSVLAPWAGTAAAKTPGVIAAEAMPAVVSIHAIDQWNDVIGEGTGFFVDDQGTLVTNWHVIDGAVRLQVRVPGGEVFDNVYFLLEDKLRDIAVLRIPAERTPAIALGSDVELGVGDPVYVIGNPMGLERTFSNGIVSARRVFEGSEVIQITAPISPGSSGGPVLDAAGEVVGIATWLVDAGQNLNMAVPVRYIRPLLAMPHTPVLFQRSPAPVRTVAAQPVPRRSARRPARIDTRSADSWEKQVLRQLADLEGIARTESLVRSHEPVLGKMLSGDNEIITITAEPKRDYMMVAVCDQDCDDIDLYLYDANATLLAQDIEDDAFPYVTYYSETGGDLSLRLKMYSCAAEPCMYGVVMFRGR